MILEHPTTASRLSPTSQIVKDPDFESGIVKILDGEISKLTNEEIQATEKLRFQSLSATSNECDDGLSLADRAMNKRKVSVPTNSSYMDIRFLLPTSNICEHLFSIAGYSLTDRSKAISPLNFGQQLFLQANKALWTIEDVNKIVN